MPGSTTRRARKRQRTRAEILAAAARLVRDTGFAEVSVAGICEEADVARATFFLHFDGKPEVLAIWERELVMELDRALASAGRGGAALQRGVADVLSQSPGVARCVILAQLADPTSHPLLSRLTQEFDALRERGELRRAPAPGLLARIWLAGVAAVLGSSEGRESSALLRDELQRVLLASITEAKPRLKWTPTSSPPVARPRETL